MAISIFVMNVTQSAGNPALGIPPTQTASFIVSNDGATFYKYMMGGIAVGADVQATLTANAQDLFNAASLAGTVVPSRVINGMVTGNTQAIIGGVVGYPANPWL